MLEATFSDVEKMFRDAVAFGLARVRPPVAADGPTMTTLPDTPMVNLQPLQDSGTRQTLEEDELMNLLEEYTEFTSALEASLGPLEAPTVVEDKQ